MVYRRPFSIVLEESLEGSTLGGETVEGPLEESELVEAVEEAAELESEIVQDSGEVDAALEEAEALSEQAAATDEVLAQTADEEGATGDEGSAITEEQVVTAEESFKWSLAKLGVASGYSKVVEVARESVAETKTRRERLKICNEGVKEFLAKLIRNIVDIAKRLAGRIILWIKTKFHVFQNYKKQFRKHMKRINKIENPSKDIDSKRFAKAVSGSPSIELASILTTSSVNSLGEYFYADDSKRSKAIDAKVNEMVNLTNKILANKEIDRSKIASEAKGGKAKTEIEEAGEKAVKDLKNSIDTFLKGMLETIQKNPGTLGLSRSSMTEIARIEFLSVAGKTYMGYNSEEAKFVKGTLEFGSDFSEVISKGVNAANIVKSLKDNEKKLEEGFGKIKYVANTVAKTQKQVEKTLGQMVNNAAEGTNGFAASWGVRSIKSFGLDLTMMEFNRFISTVRATLKVTASLASYGPVSAADDDDDYGDDD